MGPVPTAIQQIKDHVENLNMSTLLSNFNMAIEKLDEDGVNWVIFKKHFLIAVGQKDVKGHFDGSKKKLVLSEGVPDEMKKTFDAELKQWTKREKLVLYLLTQKLPDCIFAAYVDKSSVTEMWTGIVLEFSRKLILMKANLHTEFINMRYKKGADLWAEFSRICMKYVALLNIGIKVSDDDYSSLILNFVPENIAAHLANVSAGMKAHALVLTTDKEKEVELSLDASTLMQFALEEWDCRAPARKAREKSKENANNGMALATVSSEKPGAKASGGDKRKHFGKCGECWNCGDKGHKRDTCTKPKQENNNSSEGKGQQNSNSNKGKGKGNTPGPKNTTASSSSQNTSMNAAVDEEDVDSPWTIVGSSPEGTRDTYEFLADADGEEMPDLVMVATSDDENDSSAVRGYCRSEAEPPHKPNDNHGPSTGTPTVDISGRLWGEEVKAYVAKMGGKSEIAWDLYDSGASHHMLPKREDFINYEEIPKKPLTTANKETFSAVGMGDMIVSLLNGDGEAKIKLTRVLYTPALGFTLISIGCIDKAGYYSTFGGGKCEIQTGERRTVRIVPKSGGVYRVPHGSHVAAAAVSVKHMTLSDLHRHLGHISPRAVKDLIWHGIIDGIILTGTSRDFECQSCILAKTTKTTVPKIRQGERAKEFAEEIHTNLWGPALTATFGGRRYYYISFTDDWSRWTTVCLLRQKSQVFWAYKDFAAWVSTQLNKPIKSLHADRGSEYLSEAFITFLDEKGTERKLTVHDMPEQNGVAERLNYTLIEKVCAMMISCQLLRGLWGEVLMHAVWLKNRTWTRALPSGVTPYELVMGDIPVLRDIPEWGSIIWVHDTSSGKLGVHAKEGCWVSYDLNSDGHRVYWKDRGTVTVEHNIIFSKEDLPRIEDLIVEGITDEPEGKDSEEKKNNDEVSLNCNKDGVVPVPID